MIKIKNLRKSFGNVEVLKDISLTVEPGEIFGLIGRSGEGKSTLLRCINGLERFDGGTLEVCGADVAGLSGRAARGFRRNIGMIFQQFSLLSRATVYRNIALPMQWAGVGAREIDAKVRELADMVELGDKLNAMPSELSGGQKQRAAIARALTLMPKLLLCDEATSSLDPRTARTILSLLARINDVLGITIVIVTHQMSVLHSVCSRAAILERGVIAEEGGVDEIFMRHSPALQNLLGQTREESAPCVGGRLIKLLLSGANASEPVVTRAAQELGVDFIVLGGGFERYRDGMLGSLLISVDCGDFDALTAWLDARHVRWQEEVIGNV